jgi:hypothetical protein
MDGCAVQYRPAGKVRTLRLAYMRLSTLQGFGVEIAGRCQAEAIAVVEIDTTEQRLT